MRVWDSAIIVVIALYGKKGSMIHVYKVWYCVQLQQYVHTRGYYNIANIAQYCRTALLVILPYGTIGDICIRCALMYSANCKQLEHLKPSS